jgi:xanthine dehydrogenase large subunit
VPLDRDDDMIMTGKRHDFLIDYELGFDDDGRIQAVDLALRRAAAGRRPLRPICDRALFHADNAYFLPRRPRRLPSAAAPTPCSNTAFRGFGGPQGMVGIERVIEEIARATGLDPLEVRRATYYGAAERAVTPYHMTIEDNVIARVVIECEADSAYWARRERSPLQRRKSLAEARHGAHTGEVRHQLHHDRLQPGWALVHVYKDGSVHLNHGGTEMGQGLFVKVAQVVAEELALPLDRIKITATTTGKVPNTSATAASSGSDLNGMAAQAAARTSRTG